MTTDHFETLAATLLGCRLYVSLESDGTKSPLPGAWGVTSRSYDLIVRQSLELAGRWKGRAPAIYLADVSVREAAPDESEAIEMLDAILAHECGHVCDQRIDFAEPTIELTNRARALAAFSNVIQDSPSYPPFFGHGPDWLRATLHVHHRMGILGNSVPVNWLFDGEALALPEPDEWLYALSGEPEALVRVPLFDLKQFRPPLYFQQLWIANVERWRDANPSRCTDYVERSLELFAEYDK